MQTTTKAAAQTCVSTSPSKRLATIPGAAAVYPFTAAALRDLKFRAYDRCNSRGEIIKGNGSGAAGVWVQIGRKVLIDLDALDCWIESHKMGVAK